MLALYLFCHPKAAAQFHYNPNLDLTYTLTLNIYPITKPPSAPPSSLPKFQDLFSACGFNNLLALYLFCHPKAAAQFHYNPNLDLTYTLTLNIYPITKPPSAPPSSLPKFQDLFSACGFNNLLALYLFCHPKAAAQFHYNPNLDLTYTLTLNIYPITKPPSAPPSSLPKFQDLFSACEFNNLLALYLFCHPKAAAQFHYNPNLDLTYTLTLNIYPITKPPSAPPSSLPKFQDLFSACEFNNLLALYLFCHPKAAAQFHYNPNLDLTYTLTLNIYPITKPPSAPPSSLLKFQDLFSAYEFKPLYNLLPLYLFYMQPSSMLVSNGVILKHTSF